MERVRERNRDRSTDRKFSLILRLISHPPVNQALAFVAVRAFLTGDVPIRKRAPINRLRRPVPILK